MSAVSIAKMIHNRKVSSFEIVRAHLDRIELINPKIHAVCTLAAERALDEARKADEQLAKGNVKGTFHGVPMTIKDSIDTEGIVTTAGTMGRRTFVPDKDATVVRRLRQNGAILLGKTHTPELTIDLDTRSRLFETTLNPYNLSLSPGGSSGGSAAIVAAGGSAFDFGSDTGGSIRVPSSFCGIAGIRPSMGRTPLTGHIISQKQGRMLAETTRLGPLARFVEDLYPLLKVTAGPDGIDKVARPIPLGDPSLVNLDGFRVAFHTDNGLKKASTEVAETVLAAVKSLSDSGGRIEESCPRAIAWGEELQQFPIEADGYEWARKILKQYRTSESEMDGVMSFLLSRPRPPIPPEEVERKTRLLNRYRRELNSWMEDYDVLICPVTSEVTFPNGYTRSDNFSFRDYYTFPFSITDWPIAVVRCGFSKVGIPIGVQIVSKFGREDICIAVAKHLEISLGGWKKPPL